VKNLRQITDSDWNKLKTFFTLHVPSGHLAIKEFNKHWFSRPDSDNWTGFLIEDEASCIKGVMMVIEAPILLNGNEKVIGWISTGIVDESIRSLTFGPQLYFKVYKYYDVVGALSGNKKSTPINSTLGYSPFDLSMVRHLFVNSEKVALISDKNTMEEVLVSDRSNLRVDNKCILEVQNNIPKEYSTLWKRVRSNFDLITNKTEEYLNWRYIDSPITEYQILSLKMMDDLIALIIVRIQKTNAGSVLRVLDIITDYDYIDDAVRSVTKYSIDIGCIFSDFFVIGHYFNDGFKKAGYLSSETCARLAGVPHLLSPVEHRIWSNTFHIGGNLMNDKNLLTDPSRILFTKGDGDRDWPTNYDCQLLALNQ